MSRPYTYAELESAISPAEFDSMEGLLFAVEQANRPGLDRAERALRPLLEKHPEILEAFQRYEWERMHAGVATMFAAYLAGRGSGPVRIRPDRDGGAVQSASSGRGGTVAEYKAQ